MTRDQLIHEIGTKLVEDIGSAGREFAHLVLAARIERDEPEMAGFAYTKDGDHEPVAPTNFDILDLLLELRNAMAAADKKPPWRAALVRIDGSTGEIAFEFEYDKPDRWAITPKNVGERAKELSPLKRPRPST